jgi:hypothetical protein
MTDTSFSGSGTLKVEVSPNDFSFQNVPVSFANGEATVAGVPMAIAFPDLIKNQVYTFTWSIQYSGDSEFQKFQVTQHQIFLIHGRTDTSGAGADRTTTIRLEFATARASDKAAHGGLDAIVTSLLDAVNERFVDDTDSNWQGQRWAVLDSSLWRLDCISKARLIAASLQQLGYASAESGVAWPTGAIPDGDTDATSQESQTVNGAVYSLSFDNGNRLEGFVFLSPPDDVNEVTGFTVLPLSEALHVTGCTVSPSSDDNRLRFRVLTNTYRLTRVPYQEWYFDALQNEGPVPNPPGTKFGAIPLPRNNCPESESAL